MGPIIVCLTKVWVVDNEMKRKETGYKFCGTEDKEYCWKCKERLYWIHLNANYVDFLNVLMDKFFKDHLTQSYSK
jgi:hypothetical protein